MFKHRFHSADTRRDKIAFAIIRWIKNSAERRFVGRYACRAVALENIATVPGTVALWFDRSGVIRLAPTDRQHICDEVATERKHQYTFERLSDRKWSDRFFVRFVKAIFSLAYGLAYLVDRRLCHRMVGYLEEEVCLSYTQYLTMIRNGTVSDRELPEDIKCLWSLSPAARLSDLIELARNEEAEHRDRNHELANGETL